MLRLAAPGTLDEWLLSTDERSALADEPSKAGANNEIMQPSKRMHRVTGFTIIELMIAVAVVGILAALALPSFMDSIRKSRRSEAFTALAAVQQAQERWRANNKTFTTTLADLQPAIASTTQSGYYSITILAPPASHLPGLRTGYEATATAVSGTSQANDSQCSKLGVQMLDGNLLYAGCGSCTLAPSDYKPTNPCWTR